MTLFGLIENHSELALSLDQLCRLDNPAIYPFVASGQAMAPTICQGDLLLIDRSLVACSGMVVIAEYEGEFICRRLKISGERFLLLPENRRFKPIEVSELSLFGVVAWQVRNTIDEHCFS